MDDVFVFGISLIGLGLLSVIAYRIYVLQTELESNRRWMEKTFSCMFDETGPHIPYGATLIREGVEEEPRAAVKNFVKEVAQAKKNRPKAYSDEHKAKLSAARKAYWEKKKAAEPPQVTQPPINPSPT